MKPKTIQHQGRRAKSYNETEMLLLEIGRTTLHILQHQKELKQLKTKWDKRTR